MSILPIGLRCEGLRVLVVGGGPVAERKAIAFLECGACVHVVAPVISEHLQSTRHDRLSISQRQYSPTDADDTDVVVAATNDADVNAAVARDARARRCLVNRADAPEDGHFDTLAVHRAGELAIGVSAGGVPSAAVRIRDAIRQRFDDRYARAIAGITAQREQLLAEEGTDGWRRVSNDLVGEDFCERVEDGWR